MFLILVSITALAILVSSLPAMGEELGDPVAGKKVFAKCKAFHFADEPTNKVGPSLLGVIGLTPGTVEDYKYSKAMAVFGEEKVWDEENLAAYLRAPRAIVRGTKMAFVGLKKDEDVANVIAYINQFEQ